MAPKRLWGWEPRTVTKYIFDGDKVVGHVTTTEPEFDDRQVALLLAHRQLESELNSLGIPRSESTNPENQFKYKAEGPVVDWAENALAAAQKSYYDKYDRPDNPVNRSGHLWSVRLRDGGAGTR